MGGSIYDLYVPSCSKVGEQASSTGSGIFELCSRELNYNRQCCAQINGSSDRSGATAETGEAGGQTAKPPGPGVAEIRISVSVQRLRRVVASRADRY